MKSKVVKTGWSNSRRNREIWRNILRKVTVQKELFQRITIMMIKEEEINSGDSVIEI
jgi:hypothetical protein